MKRFARVVIPVWRAKSQKGVFANQSNLHQNSNSSCLMLKWKLLELVCDGERREGVLLIIAEEGSLQGMIDRCSGSVELLLLLEVSCSVVY